MVGKIPGPTKNNGQTTFSILLGLFDSEGRQAVHTNKKGEQIAVIIATYPIDTDDVPGIILH